MRSVHRTRAARLDGGSLDIVSGGRLVLLDLNLSPRVGGPEPEHQEALAHAERVLEELAPGADAR